MNNQDSDLSTLASRLRFAREQAGLSQGQVAVMLGLHRPAISEIEAGRRRVAAEELRQLSRIYDASLSWLADGTPEQDLDRDRVELAARKLSKLKPEDLDRVIELLNALRSGSEEDTTR